MYFTFLAFVQLSNEVGLKHTQVKARSHCSIHDFNDSKPRFIPRPKATTCIFQNEGIGNTFSAVY